MDLSENNSLPDVQDSVDQRALLIQRVGIKRLRHPIAWQAKHGIQHTVGEFSFAVHLPAEQKGTHMSRFVALLQEQLHPWTAAQANNISQIACHLLNAPRAFLELQFPLFIEKTAPASGVKSLMDYQVLLSSEATLEKKTVQVQLQIPVTSLCPCSKTVSAYGAHNQRSHVIVHAQLADDVWLEDIIAAVEKQASSELYGLLKRVDEKVVTERAYDNPKFVEDLVRDVAIAVRKLPGLSNIQIDAENFESIHNHSAFASLRLDRE